VSSQEATGSAGSRHRSSDRCSSFTCQGAGAAGTELAAALTRSRRSKVGRDQSRRGSMNRGVWLELGESRLLRAVLADLGSPRLGTVGHSVPAGEPPPKGEFGFAYPSTSPNSLEVVRGGIEPPTPRFSGTQNGSILANPGDLRVSGVRLDSWCGHDWSRLVTRAAGPSHRHWEPRPQLPCSARTGGGPDPGSVPAD